MNFAKSTILITGGNSGIGLGLAEALAKRGAKIIITGRKADKLKAALAANPGFTGYELDIAKDDITAFAAKVTSKHPDLNMVIQNAGILEYERDAIDLDIAERTIATNLLGPIRLTAALLPHLRKQKEAAVATVSSGLAFVPLAVCPTYSATKAAIHSWSQSLRYQLRNTSIKVLEIAPPQVGTELTPGQSKNPHSMPLDAYIEETVTNMLATPTPNEVLVERVKFLRNAEKSGNYDQVFSMLNPA
jgi:uncharacterized oxidoreductase